MGENKSIRSNTTPVINTLNEAVVDGASLVESALTEALAAIEGGRAELIPASPMVRYTEQLAERAVTTRRDLLDMVESEPALAARVLQLANTRYRDLQVDRVWSLDRGLDLLGPERIRAVIQELAAAQPPPDGWEVVYHELRKLWTHGLYVAHLARELANQTGCVEPEEAFTAGMFHHIGASLALSYYARRITRTGATFRMDPEASRIIARNQAVVGRQLMQSWSFPSHIAALATELEGEVQGSLHAVVIAGQEAALDYGYGYLRLRPGRDRAAAAAEYLGLRDRTMRGALRRIGPSLNQALTLTG